TAGLPFPVYSECVCVCLCGAPFAACLCGGAIHLPVVTSLLPALIPAGAVGMELYTRDSHDSLTSALQISTVQSAMICWPRVVLFGDSITQFAFEANGWGATLADKLVRKCDVLNRGLSGYNTRWAKLILPKTDRQKL
ncbi:unnamed protein product, partial [Staurois parvus]